ncbi:NTE family protein [Humibacillus xanthopallidus]|uniref:NTE family protein n=1 Tax=Humibacillus xanthopallidus TaxID=412689 RepID=A0A543PSB7_9MICO|nr:patatin-like phospholipase family protein [Humibacillus xanthopallidus]TQN46961.1 NTE family protein [Humibacillus xanthopallidus]
METRRTAFVLGGGGLLGAVEVGMLRALLDAGIRPDLVVGTSVGALNGALVAADPTPAVVDRLVGLWRSASEGREIYGDNVLRQAARAMRTRTHLHSANPLRQRIAEELGDRTFADLAVPFQCCAASIERATEHWFTSGSVVDAVVASAAVPGLLPPAEVDGEHYLDGGIVNSIPLGRAVELGARRIYVLQVGRAEKPLTVPTRPWEVARVSFEIARRHRYVRELAAVPAGVEVHVMPTGSTGEGDDSILAYRSFGAVGRRIEQAHLASAAYLAGVS